MQSNNPLNFLSGMIIVVLIVTGFYAMAQSGGTNYNKTPTQDTTILAYDRLETGITEISSALKEITVESQNLLELSWAVVKGIPKIIKGLLDIVMVVPESLHNLMTNVFRIPENIADLVMSLLIVSLLGGIIWLLYKYTPQATQ